MKSLSAQEKKLYSSIAIIIAGIMIVAFSYWGIVNVVKNYKSDQEKARQELIHKYESKIDSINVVNYMLTKEADSLEKEIATVQASKEYIYINTTKTDNIIKDASAAEHAEALDTITKQDPTWTIVKDSITKDTIIHYNFTKPGITKLRLYINNLGQYKYLYDIDEVIIGKQQAEIGIYKTIVANDKIAIKTGEDALGVAKESNEKLTKQLNRAQKSAKRWPYWLAGGFAGGVATCLILAQ